MSQSSGDPVMYGLYAVLVHSGYSCHAGHYYCYIKVGQQRIFVYCFFNVKLRNAEMLHFYQAIGSVYFKTSKLILFRSTFVFVVCILSKPFFLSFHVGEQWSVVPNEWLNGALEQHQSGFEPAGLRSFLPEVRRSKHVCTSRTNRQLNWSITVHWRIPETKKNADGQATKLGMLHSGKNGASSEQIKRANLNGPLSSPQVTKVSDVLVVFFFMYNFVFNLVLCF